LKQQAEQEMRRHGVNPESAAADPKP
jgi:hypothetical protein